MTEALTDNYILNNTLFAADITAQTDASANADIISTDNALSLNFDEILDKTIENECLALMDVNVDVNTDINNNINLFPDITVNDEVSDKEDEISDSEEVVSPLFEQILTYINNTETADFCGNQQSIETDDTENQNEVNSEQVNQNVVSDTLAISKSVDDTLKNTKIANEAFVKPKEVSEELRSASDSLDNELSLDDEILKELNIESVSSDSNTEYDGSAQGGQSFEEHSMKVMLNTHSDKFEFNFEKQVNLQNSVKTSEFTPEKIIEQITKQMESLKSGSKVNIVLNPESLGKVNLQILNSKDGLSALFTVTTNDARELLMKGLDGLRETLLANGVSVDNISVKVSESEESYNPDWTEQENQENGNKGQNKQKQEEKQKGLFEKTIAESLNKNNGNV